MIGRDCHVHEALKAALKKICFTTISQFLSSFYPHKSASLHSLEIAIYKAVIGFRVNAFVMGFFFFFFILKVLNLDCPLLVCLTVEIGFPGDPTDTHEVK